MCDKTVQHCNDEICNKQSKQTPLFKGFLNVRAFPDCSNGVNTSIVYVNARYMQIQTNHCTPGSVLLHERKI